MFLLVFGLGLGVSLTYYLYLINERFNLANPTAATFAAKPLSNDELAKLTYPTAEDMADAMKAAGPKTGKAYIVVGGSGFLGKHIIRSLLGRGETLVRNIDVIPPDTYGDPRALDHVSRAEYIQADVTDYETINAAISKPFGNSKVTAHVVIHTAAVIRFWERLPYLKHITQKVNVEGTKNVLTASQELGTVRAFILTSSISGFIPAIKYARVWVRNPARFGDDDPVEPSYMSKNHYPTSKREADALVRAADNVKGMRTGTLRPAVITGPGDQYITTYCRNRSPNPVWGLDFLQSLVNPWDAARAHIQYADALETRPDEIAGKGFFLSGQPTALSYGDVQRVMQFYSNRDLRFKRAPAILFYILAHVMEAFFLARYYALYALSYFNGRRPRVLPQWAVESNAMLLQPAAIEFAFADYLIDDSRARKLLGYRNLWTNEQTIKWAVECLQSGRSS